MNLYLFHKLLILCAIIFCAGFAVRALVIIVEGQNADIGTGLIGLVSAGASAALVYYLRWLIRAKSGLLAGEQGGGKDS